MSAELPPGWANARLDDVAEVRLGRQRSPDKATGNNLVPYLRAANVTWSGLDLSDVKAMQFEPKEVETYRLRSGDIVVVEASGSPGEAGKPAIWRDELPLVCMQNTLIRVRSRGPDADFLRLRLFSDARRGALGREARGVGIHHIGKEALAAWEVSLPPLNEQRRIVARLHALLARSKKARGHLARVPKLLDALKRSILAAAFRGDLTADWRAAHPDVEPASVMLERIRADRRRRWEDDLRAKGKNPKKAKYEEPAPVDESELPELPRTWAWAPLSMLGEDLLDPVQTGPFGAQLHASEFVPIGVPVVAVGNVTPRGFSSDGLYFITKAKADTLARYRIDAGDILFARSGATLGKVCLAPPQAEDWRMTGHILRLRPNRNALPQPRLVVDALWHYAPVRDQVLGKVRGATRPGFNTSLLESITIPLMPPQEQGVANQRLSELEALFGAQLDRARHLVEQLTQLDAATLGTAFRGELVAQDPNEEPASALLERVRAAQAAPTARRDRSPRENANLPPEPAKDASEVEAIDLVVGVLVGGDKLTAHRIRVLSALGKADVRAALKGLVDAGKVRVEGRARGTSYSWVR